MGGPAQLWLQPVGTRNGAREAQNLAHSLLLPSWGAERRTRKSIKTPRAPSAHEGHSPKPSGPKSKTSCSGHLCCIFRGREDKP